MYDERELLLSAPLRAESPQTLYPSVRTEKGGRSIIGCYQKGHLIEFAASRLNEAYLINANSGNELLIRFDEDGAWQLRVYDCMGKLKREESGDFGGLCEIAVPESGLIHLKRM